MLPKPNRDALHSGWEDISREELALWNQRLFQTNASLYQYPYWNEPFRKMYFSPRYLTYRSRDDIVAYVCILTIGLPGLRLGLVQRGPVSLIADEPIPLQAFEDLYNWGKHKGYIFIRFTHSDASFLDRLSSMGLSEPIEAFPFYRDLSEELIVEQVDEDRQMLSGFQQVARQEIKKASQVGYEVEIGDSPEMFAAVWPLFQKLSNRKGFRYRPLASYLDLVRLARPHQCVRLYVASLDQRPIEAILIVRDQTNSTYMSGALDLNALNGRPSPSCYLHWLAMRDLFRQGVKHYGLGTRSGMVYQFKRKFRPLEQTQPAPLTLVMNRHIYSLWSALVLRMAPAIWPLTKKLIFR